MIELSYLQTSDNKYFCGWNNNNFSDVKLTANKDEAYALKNKIHAVRLIGKLREVTNIDFNLTK